MLLHDTIHSMGEQHDEILGWGASGETEEKEVFTDEPEIEEEKETPVVAAGVPEVENGFSDEILDTAQDTSATQKHTVTIDTSPSYKIGTDKIYDVTNNHDGTLTVGEDPEIKGAPNTLSKQYSIKYQETDAYRHYMVNSRNPESPSETYIGLLLATNIPDQKIINITSTYTLFCVVADHHGNVAVANFQYVENPIKVNYDSQGGSGGPNTDWVWDVDGRWNTDHNIEPTKAGYKFAGWYTQANGNGSKIEAVSQAVNAAVAGSNDYKEITLYAKWVHEHTWQYGLIPSGSEYTFKAYCSNANSSCEYYGTSYDDAKATVSLKLEGFDNNKCVKYGNSYSVTCANSLPSEIGATIGQIIYVDRNSFAVLESETPPTSPGKYKAKVVVTLPGKYSGTTVSADFEIKPKEVTVKPDDLRKHIGEKDPKLTYTTDGIVEGETLSGITLQRESGEDARKYTIKATETEGANPNYTVTRKTGTFTIEGHKWPEDGKILSPATSWSEGMKERTCTALGCGQKRYDAIPKQDGKPADPYADKIDKYIQILGSEITAAALDNEETILFGLFPESDKTRIDNGSGAKVWLEINHVNNLDPDWQNLINTEIEKTVGKNADRILFDIDLYRQLAGENRALITDPGINMNIRIKIPDKMINNQPYTIRDYKILRLHKDSATNQATVDILDPVFNSSTNELTFKSDKFSIYVLTYKDTYYSPSYPVTGIKVSPDTLTLTKKDETAQLTAEVTPSYADNKRVTWQSSDEKVATVDENGKVTAVGNGTATITATSVSGSYTATVSVTVKIPVEIQKLTIEAEKETLTKIGESTELKVKIEPENADLQKLIWKSDNEKVATTDENGKVTAVGNGTAEITVTTEDGKITASIMITVKVPDEPTINKTISFRRLRARSVKQTKTSVTLQWNIIKDADGYFIYGNRCNTGTKSYKYRKLATITGGDISTWTQKDLKKGTYYKYVVKAYRLVNGKKVVTDTSISVHAVTGGGKYGNAKAVSVTQIGNKKNVSKITLKMGKTAQIKAKEVKKDKKIARHRKLCYESSNTKVATVTPDGLIRATGKGTCTIWVYAQNGVYKALKITVK